MELDKSAQLQHSPQPNGFMEATPDRHRIIECLERAISNKSLELEAIVGNSSYYSRNTRADFINVIKRIKGKSPFIRDTQSDSLVIGISPQSHFSKDISRIILTGALIGQYCASESLTPIMNRVLFEKKTKLDQVNLTSYGVRFNLKEEHKVSPTLESVRTLVRDWKDVDKTFRRKKTYSFYHDGGDFRVDLSLVSNVERREKVGYVLDNKLSKFVVKPVDVTKSFGDWWATTSQNRDTIVLLAGADKYYKDLKSSRAMESKDYNYEIEVEWLGNKKDNSIETIVERKAYLEQTLTTFHGILTVIIQAMQSTFFILSNQERSDIHSEMVKVLKGEPRQYFPKAVDLKPENVAELPTDLMGHMINVRVNYMVTEKADGERVLLFINSKGACYLVSMSGKILDIGVSMPDYMNSLYDGEFITRTHKGELCQNVYLFDAYIIRGINICKQPFTTGSDSRYSHLFSIANSFSESKNVLIRNDKYSARIFKKEYLEGNTSANPQGNNTRIFEACSRILQKVNHKYGGLLDGDGHLFTYAIDGLIFQPTNLAVGQNYVGQLVENIGRRWEANLKWKPEIHTTIDFRIRFNKSVGTPNTPAKPVIIYHNDRQYVDATLFIKLYIQDNEMRRYMALKLLNEGEQLEYYPEDYPFQPVYPTLLERAADGTPISYSSSIRLPMDASGTIRSENGDMIEDGMIVECRYNAKAEMGYQWIPVRVRSDKKEPNAANTVLTTWGLINNPITLDMVTSTGLEDSTGIDYFYYRAPLMNKGHFETESIGKFNNFVKATILERVLKHKQRPRVIDFGCGKLADIGKLARSHVDVLVGIDVAPDNLLNKEDGAAVRALQLNLQGRSRDSAIASLARKTFLLLGNLNKNLMNGDAALDAQNRYYLDVLYGRYKPAGRGKLEAMYGLALNQFHLALSSFTIHYFMSSHEDFTQFMLNVQENVKDQGYFVVFCLDGRKIVESLRGKKILKGDDVWSIEATDDINLDASPYGNKIIAYTDKFFRPMEENLVDCDFLINEATKYEMKLVDTKLFMDDIDDLYSEFQKVRPIDHKKLDSKPHLKEWISFHRWLIFQKADGLTT